MLITPATIRGFRNSSDFKIRLGNQTFSKFDVSHPYSLHSFVKMYGRELRWKGPPAPRAKPILPEKWEEHQEEICQLYQQMTLEDVMVIMKVRHRFTPSYVSLSPLPNLQIMTLLTHESSATVVVSLSLNSRDGDSISTAPSSKTKI